MPGEPILVVDDTPVNLKLTRMLLQHEGYEVRTAATAEEALGMLENYHPRLVLADIQLPGMDGLEMTRRIKSDPRHGDILVVALTAYAMKGDEDKAMQAGCDGYITKPIDTRALGTRLREYMDHSCPPAATPAGEVLQPAAPLLADDEMRGLRERFLREGLELIVQWTGELDGTFHAATAASAAHQWVGSAGLLGFPQISLLAREAENLLREKPLDTAQLREVLDSLEGEFRCPSAAEKAPIVAPELESPIEGRVLIADDDPNMLALVKAIVQSQSIECATASDGRAALDVIRRTRPDAVVLDVNMPGMNGYEVLRAVREEGLPTKVLLLTAEEGLSASADDYLVKPFNPIELVVRLKRMLSAASAAGTTGR